MELVTPAFGLILWTLLCLPWLILWIVALVDILKSDFRGQFDKLIWILVILLIPFLGSILYFVIGRKNKVKLNQS